MNHTVMNHRVMNHTVMSHTVMSNTVMNHTVKQSFEGYWALLFSGTSFFKWLLRINFTASSPEVDRKLTGSRPELDRK